MHYPFRRKGGISMTCTKDYREHIEYTFHAFCKVVIRNATITAARARSRKYKREISLQYLTEENHYPLSTADKDIIGKNITIAQKTAQGETVILQEYEISGILQAEYLMKRENLDETDINSIDRCILHS